MKNEELLAQSGFKPVDPRDPRDGQWTDASGIRYSRIQALSVARVEPAARERDGTVKPA